VGQSDDAEPGLARLRLQELSGVAAVVAEHLVPGPHKRRESGDRDDHRAVASESNRPVTEGSDWIREVLDHIKKHDSSRRGRLDRPGILKIVDTDAVEALAPAIVDGVGHQIKSAHVVAQIAESEQIRPAPDPTFDQQPRGRRMTTEEFEHQVTLGDVPPVSPLNRTQVLKVPRIHRTPSVSTGQSSQPGADA
jgi:hypothetical protein